MMNFLTVYRNQHLFWVWLFIMKSFIVKESQYRPEKQYLLLGILLYGIAPPHINKKQSPRHSKAKN
jgi:hypothetical protein